MKHIFLNILILMSLALSQAGLMASNLTETPSGKNSSGETPAPSSATATTGREYEALLDSTDNYIRRERWGDAARCICRSLAMRPASPLNPMLFRNLGVCLTNSGDFDGALEAFDLALVRQPDSPEVLSSRAVTYMLSDRPADARRDLDIVVAKDSLDVRSLELHGKLCIVDGDIDSARRDFTRLSAIAPENPWAAAGLAECLSAEGDNAGAIPLYMEAIKLGENPDFRESLISALIEDNRLNQAEEAIREAIALYPRTGEFYLLRGVLHRILYQNSDAELDKKLALEYGVDPQTVEKILPSKRK